MDDSCGIDFDRMKSSPGIPCSACSSGTVTRLSTSAAESPRQIVWISTRGCANSGNASTGIARSWPPPKRIIAAPAATTMKRNFRLDPTIQRITSVFFDLAVLDAPELGRADGYDCSAGARALREDGAVAVDLVDPDVMPDVRQGLGARVRPRVPVCVVQHGGVGE